MESDNDLRNHPDAFLANHQLQNVWPGCSDQTNDWPALNCLLVLLRHLAKFVPENYRSNDLARRNEELNPILKLAWQKVTNPPKASELQLRSKIAEIFGKSQGHTPRFQELLESDLMMDTLFSDPNFGLYHPKTWTCSPNAGSRQWTVDHILSALDVAKKSIIRWNGQEPLADRIMGLFPIFDHSDDARSHGERVIRHMCAKPNFLFVHYTNDGTEWHNFSSLERLSFDVSEWSVNPVDHRFRLGRTNVQYALVGVVYMHPTASMDSVRLYRLDGSHVQHPESAVMANITHDEWELEGPGTFVLIYKKISVPAHGGEEITPARETNHEMNGLTNTSDVNLRIPTSGFNAASSPAAASMSSIERGASLAEESTPRPLQRQSQGQSLLKRESVESLDIVGGFRPKKPKIEPGLLLPLGPSTPQNAQFSPKDPSSSNNRPLHAVAQSDSDLEMPIFDALGRPMSSRAPTTGRYFLPAEHLNSHLEMPIFDALGRPMSNRTPTTSHPTRQELDPERGRGQRSRSGRGAGRGSRNSSVGRRGRFF
ncbi:hypothetical protein PFICI_09972 [Pestalotiopsis fici W106-1]|uniref:Uncharacterized protein n=1 Tax=Pestalotiopsis fici (strain W106-1 / CGMCC3.15140) TaxID=1229662 RepID=W3WVN3_PESFW|nr:uncharacterized protein PFICI_09972 [Pestalotiopsis fici W106-1]ETS77910.1 hypothetical protein PFICI_09972 [Pestalotiopsis fici W106-1]